MIKSRQSWRAHWWQFSAWFSRVVLRRPWPPPGYEYKNQTIYRFNGEEIPHQVEIQGNVTRYIFDEPIAATEEDEIEIVQECRLVKIEEQKKVEELESACRKAYDHLMNLQPHIAQNVDKNRQAFIDADVDMAMEYLDKALEQKHD